MNTYQVPKTISIAVAILATIVFMVFLASDAYARGGGRGGGGFSRAGPAAGGSFSSRAPSRSTSAPRTTQTTQRSMPQSRPEGRPPVQQGTASTADRNQRQQQRQEQRTERVETRAETRQEIANDWDRYHYHGCCYDDDWGYAFAGVAVGTAVGYAAGSSSSTTTYSSGLPCNSAEEVHVNGTKYYKCDNTWYTRSYVDGNVSYVSVAAPPGH